MKVVVTGGAGFIGSHVAEAYEAEGHDVVVLDNLETGFVGNIPTGATFIDADVRDMSRVQAAVAGAGLVVHLAASRAVLRSVEDPVTTNDVNVAGTLNVLLSARDAGVRRVVVASSSSVYGGATTGPTSEDAPLRPRSPYAVSKLAGEHYARVFSELYGLSAVSLRFFNVFGPRQRPDSVYAAVIPLFLQAMDVGSPPRIHGDGLQSRDFTYVDDVVKAVRLAADAPSAIVAGRAYNVARGETVTVMQIHQALAHLLSTHSAPMHEEPRPGDVRQSWADVTSARRDLGYSADVDLQEGLRRTLAWYRAR